MSKHVKVGLCGQGADELHAGYPRYSRLKTHSELIKNRLELIDYNINKNRGFYIHLGIHKFSHLRLIFHH